MEENFQYRIGLDIGITSVGWAVLQNNSQDEPVRITDLGVRIFDVAENPKNGDALAAPRRDARTTRRRLRRRRHRLERIKFLLQENGLIEMDSFMERYYKGNLPDVYQLRYEGLDRKLKDEELAQVLIHIAKHRGFRSTRKAETKEKEGGAVLKATTENQKIMQEKGYRTVGEMLYLDEAFHTECLWNEKGYVLTPRNRPDDYKHTILRSMLVEEVHAIFAAQRALGNEKATEELENAYVEIMTSQRSFDMGPGLQPDGKPSPYAMEGFGDRVGKCTFEKDEYRAPKATYTAELFVALQKINHTKLIDEFGTGRFFTEEERKTIIDLLLSGKELKYGTIRKKLNIDPSLKFNSLNYSAKKEGETEEERVRDTEKAKFAGMLWTYEYSKCLKDRTEEMPVGEKADLFDRIGEILTAYKNDDSRSSRLEELGLSGEEIDGLLDLSPAKYQRVSLKAMRKMQPYLEDGLIYDKACEAAGYDFRALNDGSKKHLLKGEEINAIVNDITNPVVKRSVSQTIKVINAIIQKYGSPQAVNIELAREMSKNFQDRTNLEKEMKKRQQENERAKQQIIELGKQNPTGQDILKYRLWNDQGGYCLYSGKKIPLEELFDGGYDIDHILPYSITFDDSYRNKVLVTAQENRQKGNRTPYEYFGADEKRWEDYETSVRLLVRDYKKQQKLLKKNFTEEERKEFKERNLNDTKYITRVVYNMIRQNLELEPFNHPEKKKQVWAVNGAVTSYLRKRWGLMQKDRSTDRHHAMDAVVIACCTDGMIHKISRYMQGRELAYSRNFKFPDEETGEILNRDNFTREQWDEKFGVKVPLPWNSFRDELDIRLLNEDPKNFLLTHADVQRELDYPGWMYGEEESPIEEGRYINYIRPLFVSRMPNHKVTGSAHDATIRSARDYETRGVVITKVPLTDLKLNKDNEIEGYYDKDSDRLLYQALVRQLLLHGNDGKKAFAEDFHKPKSDGTEGPVVRKVKIEKKQTSGVMVRGGTGIAANGEMVRIDVFRENGKYYFVPVYTADVVRKVLPNRAATHTKPYSEWRVMDDANFVFSLYSRDLIHVKSKKDIKTNLVNGGLLLQKEIFAYYTGADIATASIAGFANDSNFKFRGLGIQSLEIFEKCQVDILGNISVVRHENRQEFH